MPALFEYSNVYNTALLILEREGYQLWVEPGQDGAYYHAERHGWEFVSPTPVGLLGLIAIFKARRPRRFREYWWRVDGRDLDGRGRLPKRPRPFKPIWERQKPASPNPKR